MWNILEHPPQPFGECSICKRHDCGEVKAEDGTVSHQQWLHFPIELDRGGLLYIGYQCAKSMTDNLGITKEFVEKPVYHEPSDEHIVSYIRRSIDRKPLESGSDPLQANIDHINSMDKAQLKAYLAEQKIQFAPQMGEDKLKELAVNHIKGASL